MRSTPDRQYDKDYEQDTYGMKLRCPACDQTFEDNNKERLIPNQGYLYNVCPACHLAYLKVRVMKGDRLGLADLHHIGQVRKKFKSTS